MFFRRQQRVAALQRGREGALVGGQAVPGRVKQIEPPVGQALQQRRRGERQRVRCDQFNGQGQIVEQAADCCDRVTLRRRQFVARLPA